MFNLFSCKTSRYPVFYKHMVILNCDNCNDDSISYALNSGNNKSITLKNDSILEYYKSFGGLGSITTAKYSLIDCQIKVDSLDVYGRVGPKEFLNMNIIYSIDSLVNNQTGEIYYNQKYLDKLLQHKK